MRDKFIYAEEYDGTITNFTRSYRPLFEAVVAQIPGLTIEEDARDIFGKPLPTHLAVHGPKTEIRKFWQLHGNLAKHWEIAATLENAGYKVRDWQNGCVTFKVGRGIVAKHFRVQALPVPGSHTVFMPVVQLRQGHAETVFVSEASKDLTAWLPVAHQTHIIKLYSTK